MRERLLDSPCARVLSPFMAWMDTTALMGLNLSAMGETQRLGWYNSPEGAQHISDG